MLQELVPSILSILTFALLICVALRSSDVLRAAKYFRISVVTTVLAVVYLVVHAIQIVLAVRSGAGGAVQELVLFIDGLTVLLPSILLMRAAAAEKKGKLYKPRLLYGPEIRAVKQVVFLKKSGEAGVGSHCPLLQFYAGDKFKKLMKL